MSTISPGNPFPLGAHVYHYDPGEGVNFSVYSRGSTGMDLLLFDHVDDGAPARVIPMEPHLNRTFHYWHIFVGDLSPGQLYGFRAQGPYKPDEGLRFDSSKILLDPYSRGIAFPQRYDRQLAGQFGADNAAFAPKSVLVDTRDYNWEGDQPLNRPFAQTVIYEMHPAGFTRNPNSGVAPDKRGTYAGLIEKIPYLQDLGVTAVELMPVFAFDPHDAPDGRVNYWGYTPISFFAPHPFYSSRKTALGAVNEFRDMVKAFHREGIEVILDVVYNHTSEGDEDGPTLSFRGLANQDYYILNDDPRGYANYSGVGNTLKANNPVVRRLILDSLRYWVTEMHVDGFRFDLAAILSRDEDGHPLPNSPILLDIETDPYLAGAKLIAEAWDAAGLYEVGSFIGERWQEWNGKFRDDIRTWVRGDKGSIAHFPNRILGSPDVYEAGNRQPEQSINFVTCHDGFTLNDLVSYNRKHNDANNENNRDGADENFSWNHGEEGPSQVPAIEMLRARQIKNFLAYTLLSVGVPMIQMGDEARRTQEGNNNAYAQDNEIAWFNWDQVEPQAGLRRLVRELIRFRLNVIADPVDEGLSLSEQLRAAKITWHGVRLHQPDWSPDSHSLAMTIETRGAIPPVCMIHYIFNSYWGALTFDLPPLPQGKTWRRLLDTNLPAPDDMAKFETAIEITGSQYRAENRSVVVLITVL